MKRPSGFALVSAIFILVVLAVLGAFILSVSSSQHMGSALDIQGVRAFQAARAGIEWGLYQANATAAYNFSYGTPAVAVGNASPNNRVCPAATASFVPPAATLAGFVVTVTCIATPDPGGNGGPTVYRITSTACSEPVAGWAANTVACPNTGNHGPLYAERRMTVVF